MEWLWCFSDRSPPFWWLGVSVLWWCRGDGVIGNRRGLKVCNRYNLGTYNISGGELMFDIL
jgi:hypothetical protein